MNRETLNAFLGRVGALFRRRRLDQDLEDELALHLAMREERERAARADPAEARTAALRRFGNVTALKESCRDVWTFRPLEVLAQDARYAMRTMRRDPGFFAAGVITLALGIGATTAVSALLDATLLRPLPVHHPDHLFVPHWIAEAPKVSSGTSIPGCGEPGRCTLPFPVYETLRERQNGRWAMAAFSTVQEVQVAVRGEPSFAGARFVTGNYLSLIGAEPAQGRTLTDSDDQGNAVVLVSDSFWRARLGADPTALGGSIAVNGTPFTVVGIAAPGFHGIHPAHAPDMWIPLGAASLFDATSSWVDAERMRAPDALVLGTLVRLRPDVDPQRVRDELATSFRQLLVEGAAPVYDFSKGADVTLTSVEHGLNSLRTGYGGPLRLLDYLVRLTLAVACANVACLLLARALRRRREIATRLAIGSGPYRLLFQLFTEGLVLALFGAALGLALGFWGSRVLALALSPGIDVGALTWTSPSLSLLGRTAALTALTTLGFALVPAWAAWRSDPAADLVPSRSVGAGWALGSGRLGCLARLVVVAEVAASLVLLVGAGLFVRTLTSYAEFDPGFRTDHLLTVAATPVIGAGESPGGPAELGALQENLAALPGIEQATWTTLPILGEGVMFAGIWSPGWDPSPGTVVVRTVGPRFFGTMGIAILAGRDVTEADWADGGGGVWLNEALADQAFPEGSALGTTLRVADAIERPVVGIVADTAAGYIDAEPPRPAAYVAGAVVGVWDTTRYLVLRTSVPPLSVAQAVEATARRSAPDLLVRGVKDEAQHVAAQTSHQRLLAAAAAALGALTLVLAAVGLYGVLAYSVSRRTGEIAIRMSLGALPMQVLRLVLSEGALVVLAGVCLGAIAAWWTSRSFSHFLFGIGTLDVPSYVGASVLLVVLATIAMYLPARRASRVDPAVALRAE